MNPSPVPRESGVWLPDRLEEPKARRERLRWYAVVFNGIFLSLFGLGRLGAFIACLGIFCAGRQVWDARRRLSPLQKLAELRGVAEGMPVRIEIRREGVLLGIDEGWVGRRGGVLVFEGRRTRFELVSTDLTAAPTKTLQVRSDVGSVTVDFQAASKHGIDSHQVEDLLAGGWSFSKKERKELSGPPTLPNERRPFEFYLASTFRSSTFWIGLAFTLFIYVNWTANDASEGVYLLQTIAPLVICFVIPFVGTWWRDINAVIRLATMDEENAFARLPDAIDEPVTVHQTISY
jgi:hypothetical protein